MSWLARSIANSLNLDNNNNTEPNEPNNNNSGVKQDLSELTTSLSRQFWGVASFLAPPPVDSNLTSDNPDPNSGIRADLGEKFRTGISRISNNINVSQFTKVASSFLQLESDDEDGFGGGVVLGVNDGVVEFARDLALRPETWLNFPLPDDDDGGVDLGFELSDAQQEHALAVERLAPELAALRIELSPGYMSESCFWMIYFLLIHPRLDKQDAELLSTPQIEKARALLAPEVNNQTSGKPEKENPVSIETYISRHEELSSVPSPSLSEDESNKAAPENSEIESESKSVSEGKDAEQVKGQSLKPGSLNVNVVTEDEDDADDWLKEENVETVGASTTSIPIENDDDVSFSDLEEDEIL